MSSSDEVASGGDHGLPDDNTYISQTDSWLVCVASIRMSTD